MLDAAFWLLSWFGVLLGYFKCLLGYCGLFLVSVVQCASVGFFIPANPSGFQGAVNV